MANEKENAGSTGRDGGLDEYGVWVKSAPQNVPLGEIWAEAETAGKEEPLYEEGEFVSIEPLPEFESAAGKEAKDASDKPSAVTALEAEAGAAEAGETEEVLSFQETETVVEEPAPEEAFDDDLSTRLLKKIVKELSSIRFELANLKREFSEDKEDSTGPSDDFPAEDGDKTFLTSDELDNLLASSPEESAPEKPVRGGTPAEESTFEETALPEEAAFGEPAAEEPAPEEAAFEEPAEEEAAAAEEPAPQEETPDEKDSLDGLDLDIDLELPPEPEKESEDEEAPPAELEPAALAETAETAPDSGEADSLPEEPPASPAEEAGEPEEAVELENSGFEEPLPETGADEAGAPAPAEEPEADFLDELGLDDFSLDLGEDDLPDLDSLDEITLPEDETAPEAEPLPDAPAEDKAVSDEAPPPDDASTKGGESLETGETDESADALIPEGFAAETEPAAAPPVPEPEPAAAAPQTAEPAEAKPAEPPSAQNIPAPLKQELRTVLSYMDRLLESLPDDKIAEFANSAYFDAYKKLFNELGLV